MSVLRTVKALQKGLVGGIVTPLKERSLFLVEGKDTYKFLNGLVTQEIVNDGETSCKYGAFLNVKGRAVCDALMYHRPTARDFLIEVDSRSLPPLLEHLNRYKLRQNVRIDTDVSAIYDIYAILARDEEWRDKLIRNLLNRGDLGHTAGVYADPRWPLALRVYVPKGAVPPLGGLELHWEPERRVIYDYCRLLHGIYEGEDEIIRDRAVILECQMHWNNGLHLDKGCYLGQELIARTYHRGELHKGLFTLRYQYPYAPRPSIQVHRSALVPAEATEAIAEMEERSAGMKELNIFMDGKKSGRVLNGVLDLVVGYVRLEHAQRIGDAFTIGKPDSEDHWQLIQPPWLVDVVDNKENDAIEQ